MLSNSSQPFVSVIVPVYNGELMIEKNIQSLLDQDYPKDKYEIIIIDNGSSDMTRELIKKYPVTLLQENEIQTSYAARNQGIIHAQGTIIAFTDADCSTKPDWISQGVRCFAETDADMVGGKISFTFSDTPTAAELLDSLINLHNESSTTEKGGAKTANVFVKKELFEQLGMFQSDQKSGEDIGWTGRASHAGFNMVYASQSIVEHPARNFSELLEKHVRVGIGSVAVWKSQGRSWMWIFLRFSSLFLPILSLQLPRLIKQRGDSKTHYPIIRMMVIAWLCKVATGWGVITKR
jgi:glycosyltransferase involved in cell wall biosynthesis